MAQDLIEPAGSADAAGALAGDTLSSASGGDTSERAWLWLVLKIVIGALIVLILPHFVSDQFYLYSLTVGALYLIAALGLNLTISGGIISIGTSAFLMIGA